MRVTRLALTYLGLIALICGVGVAKAQEPKPPATLWTFLGFPPAHKVHDHLANKKGNHPGLERKPPILPIADPKNLKSPVPAIKKAAEVKEQEDLAPQKIKGIKYLAIIGCGCYNRDGSITEALLAALDDCTETVRLAAAEAIADSAGGDVCENCGEHSCCSKEIHDRLTKMAYETNKEGCWIEPSERVRRAAMRALLVCPPQEEAPPGPIPEMPPAAPELPPGTLPEAIPPAPAPTPPDATAPTPADPALIPPAEARTEEIRQLPRSSRRTAQRGRLAVTEVASHSQAEAASPEKLPMDQDVPSIPPIVEPPVAASQEATAVIVHSGVVEFIDYKKRLVVVRTEDDGQLPRGAMVQASHRFLTGPAVVGRLQVVASEPGVATLQPLDGVHMTKIARGDRVNVTR